MKAHVLVVDDDPDILEALSLVLEDRYDVATARHGKEALARLEARVPDVILLDLMMPVMNGPEFLSCMRQRRWNVPVVVASAGTDLQRHCAELGVDDWLAKPFDARDLEAALERVLARHVAPHSPP